jgi:acetolactate synthase-1/2/3 large subunit
MGGHESVRNYLRTGVDVIVAVGTSLGDMASDGFSSLLQAPTFIHVDIDARQIGRSYTPTHAVVASAADFFGALADQLGDSRCDPIPCAIARHVLPSSNKPNRIAAQDAIRGIQAALPHDAIYTVDSGEHFIAATHYLNLSLADQYIVMTGLGSMGQSIGAAIGAQLAHPMRVVAAICGDGCFAMNAFELATAAQQGLPIRVFVFNDERLGMVEHGHLKVYGRKAEYPTTPLDVCAVARGLGAKAMRLETLDHLRATSELLKHPGPVVFDVAIDHEVVLPKPDRVAAMNKPVQVFAVIAPRPVPEPILMN